MQEKQGKMLIFSAPSGSGKTTIVRSLMKVFGELAFSVSACSRPMRKGEVDGRDYYFLGVDEFRERIAHGEFLEWEEVYPGRYYGTLLSEVERIWNEGKHVVFDVDVVGGLNIKRKYPERSLAVFVMTPSIEVLEQRLRSRSSDSEGDILTRLDKAKKELASAPQFDRILINDDLGKAVEEAVEMVDKFLNDGC